MALHNSIAAALDPSLDIADRTFPMASAIDVWVRDPPAVKLRTGSWCMIGIATEPLALDLLNVQFIFCSVFLIASSTIFKTTTILCTMI